MEKCRLQQQQLVGWVSNTRRTVHLDTNAPSRILAHPRLPDPPSGCQGQPRPLTPLASWESSKPERREGFVPGFKPSKRSTPMSDVETETGSMGCTVRALMLAIGWPFFGSQPDAGPFEGLLMLQIQTRAIEL